MPATSLLPDSSQCPHIHLRLLVNHSIPIPPHHHSTLHYDYESHTRTVGGTNPVPTCRDTRLYSCVDCGALWELRIKEDDEVGGFGGLGGTSSMVVVNEGRRNGPFSYPHPGHSVLRPNEASHDRIPPGSTACTRRMGNESRCQGKIQGCKHHPVSTLELLYYKVLRNERASKVLADAYECERRPGRFEGEDDASRATSPLTKNAPYRALLNSTVRTRG